MLRVTGFNRRILIKNRLWSLFRQLSFSTAEATPLPPTAVPPPLRGWIGWLRGRWRWPPQRKAAGLRELAVPRKT